MAPRTRLANIIMPRAVAIDSNALTYLIEANQDGYDPAQDLLGPQRLAMLWTFFYSDRLLWVPPTVETEYKRIKDPERYEHHRRTAQYILEDQPLRVDTAALEARVQELNRNHGKESDCRVVAETEFANLDVLLTCDEDLRKHLTGVSPIKILSPTEFWISLAWPAGSAPVKEPAPGHPLFEKSWWRLGDT